MTESQSLKRGECKLRYLRALKAKQKEIENKEKRCQSLSSTLEIFRENLKAMRAERDKLEEECRLRIDAEELQEMMSLTIKSYSQAVCDMDLRCLTDTEILTKLFLNTVAFYVGFLTFAGSGFRASQKACTMSGPSLIVYIARQLGCEVRGNWEGILCSYELQPISDFWVELALQIVEAKRTQTSA